MASTPISSWQIEGGKVEAVTDFLFLGSKITAHSDCGLEIKRCLLLVRTAVTGLDSILKSKDIPLLTKIHIVKAIVFPVVTYTCESWTIKKATTKELMLSNCGAGEDSWLRVPCIARRSNQSILKEINPECSLEGLVLKLKLQYFGHLMQRANSLEKTLVLGMIECKRRGWQRMRWLEIASPTQWTWIWANLGR